MYADDCALRLSVSLTRWEVTRRSHGKLASRRRLGAKQPRPRGLACDQRGSRRSRGRATPQEPTAWPLPGVVRALRRGADGRGACQAGGVSTLPAGAPRKAMREPSLKKAHPLRSQPELQAIVDAIRRTRAEGLLTEEEALAVNADFVDLARSQHAAEVRSATTHVEARTPCCRGKGGGSSARDCHAASCRALPMQGSRPALSRATVAAVLRRIGIADEQLIGVRVALPARPPPASAARPRNSIATAAHRLRTGRADRIFAAWDDERAGALDLRAFLHALVLALHGSTREKLSACSTIADINGDGAASGDGTGAAGQARGCTWRFPVRNTRPVAAGRRIHVAIGGCPGCTNSRQTGGQVGPLHVCGRAPARASARRPPSWSTVSYRRARSRRPPAGAPAAGPRRRRRQRRQQATNARAAATGRRPWCSYGHQQPLGELWGGGATCDAANVVALRGTQSSRGAHCAGTEDVAARMILMCAFAPRDAGGLVTVPSPAVDMFV